MQNLSPKFKSDLNQRCFDFSLKIIALADRLPNKRSAWVIMDQLLRSGTSVGANLVEARSSSSRLEYKKFYEIALKSANETRYWLELLKDSNLVERNSIQELLSEVTEIANMLGAGVIKLKSLK
jgi:four helix bundle protein